ncbi:hypothetical protein [Ligilactobacillus apodemi]|uniref:SEC10/PgrA surface exclusion domain-containing protein n=1 Tax=Ligilactobacillus apodemi DSM 16634 = JCM 16172 TaxID=1423724 RepID=A0A0R1TS35_9LACO|nr:hypothetical protein [Ligilactobacillus apodemi]KRL84191.1 hypothetical protein FC32_GL001474 [Ligilactobacillus apodemi DSM 16634 = JCM 16172]MCR1901234.1 hypothetical protein [Ligilactobacillus apodemi]
MKNKKLLFGATALAATLTTGVKAQADSVNTTQATTQQATTQSPADQVTAAQDNYAQANSAASQAEQAATDAQQSVDSAKEALDSVQATKDQATDEAITTAKNELTATNTAKEDAENTVSDLQTKVDDQQKVVNQAQSELNQANDNLTAATDAKNSADAAVSQAQQAVTDQQQASELASQLQNQANTEQQAVDSAQDAYDTAQAQQTTAEKNLSDAQTNKETADAQVETKTAEVSQVQADVDSAQKALDSQGASDTLSQTQTDYDNAVTAQKDAESDVTAKTEAKQNTDNQLADAQNALNDATTAQQSAQTAVDNATSAQQAQASEVAKLEQQLANANQSTQTSNIQVSVTDELKAAVQKYVNDTYAGADKTTLSNDAKAIQGAWDTQRTTPVSVTSTKYSGSEAIIITTNDYSPIIINYTPSQSDYDLLPQADQYNEYGELSHMTKKLTPSQILEIEQFVADMINATRDAFGISDKVGHVILNQDAIDLAQELAYQDPVTVNKDLAKSIAEKYGVSYATLLNELLYEQTGTYLESPDFMYKYQMVWLKIDVARTFPGLLNRDYKIVGGSLVNKNGNTIYDNNTVGAYSKSILGISPYQLSQVKDTTNKDSYFGFNTASLPPQDTTNPMDRFIYIYPSMITDPSKFDTTSLSPSTTDTSALQSQLATAKDKLNTLNSALSQAQANLDSANTALTNAQNASNALTSAQATLQAANDNLATATTALAQAKQAYEDSLKDTATKEANLQQAQNIW